MVFTCASNRHCNCRQHAIAGLDSQSSSTAPAATSNPKPSDAPPLPANAAQPQEETEATWIDYVKHYIRELGAVVQHGRKRAIEALPRWLSAYTDYGTEAHKIAKAAEAKGLQPAAAAMVQRLHKAAHNGRDEVRIELVCLPEPCVEMFQ